MRKITLSVLLVVMLAGVVAASVTADGPEEEECDKQDVSRERRPGK